MKKNFLYGLIVSVSMISICAYADPTEQAQDASNSALTTKGYVDEGLKYVYDVANGTSNGAVKTLQQTVGGLQETIGHEADPGNNVPASGLVGDVANLQGALSDGQGGLINVGTLKQTVDGLQTSTYSGGDGVTVTQGTNGAPGTIKLGLPANPGAGSYVYQVDSNGTGTWAPIEVEDSWNPGFLTNQ